jgi:hypothetical protein
MTRILLLGITLVALAGCRQQPQVIVPDEATVTIDLSVAPNPPAVGDATLVISVEDENGDPINNANIAIRGDMNHAGMQPVLRDVTNGREGDYTVPFEWTMGGDWYVVVTATLPDGKVVEKQFDYVVASDGTMQMDDMATEAVSDES